MAFLAPVLPYLLAGATGVALGRASKKGDKPAETAVSAPTPEQKPVEVDTTPVPPAAPEPVTPPASDATTEAGSSTAAGGDAEATAMEEAATTEAEKDAAGTARKGRRSTILTTSRGLLSEEAGTLRSGRSLMGGGLIR